MNRLFWLISLFALLLGLAACGPGQVFEDPSARATREARGTLYAQTAVAAGTQAATLIALQATADHAVIMATQIGQLTSQSQALQATLAAMSLPRANQGPQTGPLPQSTLSVQSPGGSSVTTYQNLTTSSAINNADGCALDSTSTFGPNQSKIYVTVVAFNVPKGVHYTAHWYHNGTEIPNSGGWTANTTYDRICIWFFRESPFDVGNWSVELRVDTTQVGKVDFAIADSRTATAPPTELPK